MGTKPRPGPRGDPDAPGGVFLGEGGHLPEPFVAASVVGDNQRPVLVALARKAFQLLWQCAGPIEQPQKDADVILADVARNRAKLRCCSVVNEILKVARHLWINPSA